MNTDKINNAKDIETVSAKLRNALSPHYGLPSVILKLREHPEILKISEDMANQAIKNNMVIDSLLKQIDDLCDQTEMEEGIDKEELLKWMDERIDIIKKEIVNGNPDDRDLLAHHVSDRNIYEFIKNKIQSLQPKESCREVEFATWLNKNCTDGEHITKKGIGRSDDEMAHCADGYYFHYELKKQMTIPELFQLFLKQNSTL